MRTQIAAITTPVRKARWHRRLSGLLSMARGLVSPRMSPVLFSLDFVVYPALVIASLAVAFAGEGSALLVMAMALLGYVIWTLVEYLAHRYVLHHLPVFAELHRAHHDAPRDLVGTPTLVSSVLFLVLAFWPTFALTNLQVAAALMAGLWSGYLVYAAAHYAIHHTARHGSKIFRTLKRHHARHHYRDGQSNFGVTTTLWDHVFGTLAA